jgi:hypothetical protein
MMRVIANYDAQRQPDLVKVKENGVGHSKVTPEADHRKSRIGFARKFHFNHCFDITSERHERRSREKVRMNFVNTAL